MFNNLLKNNFSLSEQHSSTTINPSLSTDTRVEIECQQFLPEVSDTWTFIRQLSTDTTRFREIYELYKYERTANQQKDYFNQLKILHEKIYKLSITIHQHIQSLEKLVQPIIKDSSLNDQNYKPAYIRIVQNQLNSLKLSFKRIITTYNSDSMDYQNDLKQSIESQHMSFHPNNTNEENPSQQQQQIQLQLSEELQIEDLEARLESVRVLKERIRQMK